MTSQPPAVPDTNFLQDQSRRTTDRALLTGIAWTGGVKWVVQILTWTSTLVVARLITPEDFGIVGSAALYLGLMSLLADFGVGMAVLTMRDIPETLTAQLNGAGLLFGAFAMAVGLASAWPLGMFFRSSEVAWVLAAMSATLLVSGLRSVPMALLQRSLRFRTVALIEAAQGLVGSLTTIFLALAGWGYWALAAGAIIQATAYAGFVLHVRPTARAWPRFREIKEPLRLSAHVLTSGLSWWIYSNADFAIAGRMLGQRVMGGYLLAWEFASLPVEKITNIVTRVTPAIFSALQHDVPGLRRQFLTLTEGIAMLTLPASWGLALVADDFVRFALGDQWLGAIAPLQILCAYISFRSVVTLLSQVLLVTGDSRLNARMGIVFMLVMPAAFLIGSRWGTAGIAMAWVLVYPFLTIPIYRRVFLRLELTVGAYLHAVRRPLIGSVVMVAAVLLLTGALPAGTSLLISLVLKIGVGAIVYVTVSVWPQRVRLMGILRSLRTA